MQYLDAISKTTGWSLFISKGNHWISRPCGCCKSPPAPWSMCFKWQAFPCVTFSLLGAVSLQESLESPEAGTEGNREYSGMREQACSLNIRAIFSRLCLWSPHPGAFSMLTSSFLHPALLHGPHVLFRRDGDSMGLGRPHGGILCQSLMNNDAWLPYVFSIMWPEASGGTTAGPPLTVRETGQAPGGMGLCPQVKLTLNTYPATDNREIMDTQSLGFSSCKMSLVTVQGESTGVSFHLMWPICKKPGQWM